MKNSQKLNSKNKDIVMPFLFFILFTLGLTSKLWSQTPTLSWENYIVNNSGFDMELNHVDVDSFGNSYSASSRFNGLNYDIILTKHDSQGIELWTSVYNGTNNLDDFAAVVKVDSNGNPHVAGRTFTGTGNFDMLVLKYSPNGGVPLWSSVYNNPASTNDLVNDITFDNSNNVIAVGQSNFNGRIRKLSFDNGALLWEAANTVAGFEFSGNSNSFMSFKRVLISSSGVINVLVEYSNLSINDNYAGLRTYNNSTGQGLGGGGYWWFGTSSEYDIHYPKDIVIANNGIVYVCAKDSNGNFIILQSTDYSGSPFSIVESVGASEYEPTNMFCDNNNQLYVCGRFDSNSGSGVNYDMFASRIGQSGDVDWLTTQGGEGFDSAIAIVALANQAFICVNETGGSNDLNVKIYRLSNMGAIITGFPVQYVSSQFNSSQMSESAVGFKVLNTSTFIIAGNSVPANLSTDQSVFVAKFCSYSGVVNITGTNEICQGSSGILNATGGTSYLWSPSSWLSSSTVSNPTISVPLTATGSQLYTCTFTDAQGCSTTDTHLITIKIKPAPPIISANGGTQICQGESTTLTANLGSSVTWQPVGILSSSLNVGSGGAYSATVTQNGCVSNSSNIITVTVLNNPVVSVLAPPNNAFCDSGELTATVSNGQPPYSYLWSNGESINSIDIFEDGTYSVTVTDANSCTSSSTPFSITIYPTPSVPSIEFTSVSDEVCAPGVLEIEASLSGSILWFNGQLELSGINSNVLQLNAVGDYAIRAKRLISGCASEFSNLLVGQIHPENTSQILPFEPLICDNQPTILSVSTENSEYNWMPNGEQTSTIEVSEVGEFSVEVVDFNGCMAVSSVSVVPGAIPTVPTIISIDNTLYSSSELGNQWYLNGEVLEGEINQFFIPQINGVYSVSASNACGTSTSEAINVDWIVSVEELNYRGGIFVYPTIANERVLVEAKDGGIQRIDLLNVQGNLIESYTTGNSMQEILVRNFSKGIYLLKVYSLDGGVNIQRIIVN